MTLASLSRYGTRAGAIIGLGILIGYQSFAASARADVGFFPIAAPTADAASAAEALSPTTQPLYLAADADNTIYAQPATVGPTQGTNEGGTNVDLNFDYFNHDVYRGVDHSLVGGRGDTANLESEGRITFDLGRLPHPFVGVFANVFDSDPVSRFQEIRPYFGAELKVRPLNLSAGDNTYIYPEREDFDTSEVWGKIEFDDSLLFHTDEPIASPYVYGAYDYSKNKGWYLESGIKHDFVLEQTGITITPFADIAYIVGFQQEFVFIIPVRHADGFQHYDVGVQLRYSLNTLFNFSKRFGEFTFKASVTSTNAIQARLGANNVLWGGVGIGFQY